MVLVERLMPVETVYTPEQEASYEKMVDRNREARLKQFHEPAYINNVTGVPAEVVYKRPKNARNQLVWYIYDVPQALSLCFDTYSTP